LTLLDKVFPGKESSSRKNHPTGLTPLDKVFPGKESSSRKNHPTGLRADARIRFGMRPLGLSPVPRGDQGSKEASSWGNAASCVGHEKRGKRDGGQQGNCDEIGYTCNAIVC